MPNLISSTGLQTATRAELLASLTASLQATYGPDINLDASTPDGQMLNIFIQMVLDLEDLLTQIYNQFDPDNAFGVVLDQRVSINGIQRQAGTFTIQNIVITTDRALTLYGMDQVVNPIYTVSDNAGNQFQLVATTAIPSAGSYTLTFQSVVAGRVLTTANTITVPVTIILGVTGINNPSTYTTLGINEETDFDLKIRRQKSVSLASQGYLKALVAALENINGVTTVVVYENNTAATDGDGIPSHSIWVIIGGSGVSASIANAIYRKRNAGCGMKGTQTFVITQIDGSQFVVRWDVVTPVSLFTKFTTTSLDGITIPNIAAIRSGLVTSFVPGLFQQVNINELSTLVQNIDPNTLVTGAGFSTSSGGAYTNSLTPAAKNNQFSVISDNIIILPILIDAPNALKSVVGGVVTTTLSIAHSAPAVQFTTLGGFGTMTYTKTSGTGTVTTGGLYTPPATSGSDVIRATDALGNFIECVVTVT